MSNSWRDLKPLGEWYEPERPDVRETLGEPLVPGSREPSTVTLTFTDDLSRAWFAAWLRSRRCWAAYMTWVDEKRLTDGRWSSCTVPGTLSGLRSS